MSRKHVNCERKFTDTEHSLRSCVLAGGVSMCILSIIKELWACCCSWCYW